MNIVMGAAVNYTREDIRPFLKSLQVNGYTGRIIMFADGGAAKECEEYENVQVIHPPKVRTFPHSERFIWMMEELMRQGPGMILCTDTRDVIFQSDLREMPNQGLHVYQEDLSMTIRSCPYNSEWVRIGYGEEGLSRIGHHPISCVGTIYGEYHYVMRYLSKLLSEILRLQPLTQKFQDQSCHNHLIYTERFGQTIWANEGGDVYTVGHVPRETVRIVEGKIVNANGKAPAVIHQWDRHQNLTAFVKERYV